MRLTQPNGATPLRLGSIWPLQAKAEPSPVDVRTLYDRHGGQCFTLALHLLAHDYRAAEDVVHEVFVERWRAAETEMARRGSVHTWFLQTTRRACLDRIRQRTGATPEQYEWTLPEASA